MASSLLMDKVLGVIIPLSIAYGYYYPILFAVVARGR